MLRVQHGGKMKISSNRQKGDANRNKIHETARWSSDVGMVIVVAEEGEYIQLPPPPRSKLYGS
jgi:murein tripeptide amidase MpaA